MQTSTDRILTTHVGSMPRPESIRALLRAGLAGQPVDEAALGARAAEAVRDVVRRQAEVGLDVVSDGEMSKTSFLAYTDARLTGFVSAGADPSAMLTDTGFWTRRVDSRKEWRAFREYYAEYLPREMPLAAAPTVCEGPITYKGQALLDKDLKAFKAALGGVAVAEAFVPAIARPWSAAARTGTTRPTRSTSSPSPRHCGRNTGPSSTPVSSSRSTIPVSARRGTC
jgi:5-methyltetrahydropteroyltriglutamate--homocysteine methyltransferase